MSSTRGLLQYNSYHDNITRLGFLIRSYNEDREPALKESGFGY